MRRRVAILLLATAFAALAYRVWRPARNPPPTAPAPVQAARPPPPPPAAVVPPPALPATGPGVVRLPLPPAATPRRLPAEIPIQDQSTMDFSRGTPVIRSGPNDDGGLERALREMADATRGLRLHPDGKVDRGETPPPAPPP